MATINLDQKEGQQHTLGYVIIAEKETFKLFNMFEKIIFKEFYGENFKLLGFHKKKSTGNLFIEYDDYNMYEINADYVQYVAAYYNKKKNDFPLIIEINRYGTKKFYKCSELLDSGHDIFKLKKQSKSYKLADDLITESDIINQTLTYRIDKKEKYNNINLEVKQDPKLGYTIFTHKPKIDDLKDNKSCVLYDKYLFEIKKGKLYNSYEDNEGTPKVYSVQGMIFNSINVYYRKKDNNDNIPLLVECIEHNNGKKYYFSRKNQYEKKWNIYDLENDESDYLNLSQNEEEDSLKHRLDLIEFQIKHSVLVLLHKKNNYKKGEMDPTVKYNEITKNKRLLITPDRIKNDTVYVEKVLKSGVNYECHKHNLQSYTEVKDTRAIFTFGSIDFRVLKFFISTRCVEIYDEDSSIPLLYNHKNLLYVYFYKNDHFPLLIKYGFYFYGPKSKDKYFVEWEKIQNIKNKINEFTIFDIEIIEELDKINSMLNEVDIHKTSDYGIDDYEYDIDEYKNKEHLEKSKLFDFTRIEVKKEDVGIYRKFTHKSKNKSQIQQFFFNKKYLSKDNILTNGIYSNSVSVYYFMYDATAKKENPLILELDLGSDKFKYYILQNNKPVFNEYKHKSSNNSKINNGELNKLLKHQNFIFNKVISILLEKSVPYTCCDTERDRDYITFVLKNNYNLCYINSNKDIITEPKIYRFIDVKSINVNSLVKSGNFVLFKHYLNISDLDNALPLKVNLELTSKTTNFTINKIIIQNKVINLKYRKETKERLFKTKAAYVHFYRVDPRPLLVYCNNVIFFPQSIDKYFVEWEATNSSEFFKYYDINNFFTLLEYKLNEIYYNLTPVYLDNISRYCVMKEFNEPIIEVKSQNFTIFKKFIHTISDGYKFGVAKYKDYLIIGNYELYEYKSSELECISAYYLNIDNEYNYPLLIEFRFKGNKLNEYHFNEYYELKSIRPYEWKKLEIKNTYNYMKNYKHKHLINLFTKLIKDPEIPVETYDTNPFDDEYDYNTEDFNFQGQSSEDYFYKKDTKDSHIENYDSSENFKPRNISIKLPLYDQDTNTLYFEELDKLEQSIYDNSYDSVDHGHDGNSIKSFTFEVTDFNNYEEMIYHKKDLESGRNKELERCKTESALRKARNVPEYQCNLSTRTEASVGGEEGTYNISGSNLGPALGGVFGSLFFIVLAAYPAYKFYKKFKIKDMRPIF